ncbi:rhodanese-like domain-containing protein [Bacillus sp. UNCCL81]|uniref:rhodanese-like domain-containing protein n=1 Tax=Bacillus sp. UNCCL81 TaxID=1502755 RepID=UPI0008E14181|nr:rhodanese-like domain-containing protein [Bacillus sp. UNCCL81]SFC37269.1 Rhodanese-related sulfurtransferase [Bacillus sp. UNCCL81]
MENLKYIITGLLFLIVVKSFLPIKGIRQISITELKNELKNKNKQFIDVRTPSEYKSNSIRGFKNIPLHVLDSKINLLSKDKEIVVICQSGMRSKKASKKLKKHGFKQVTNVKGGMSLWK